MKQLLISGLFTFILSTSWAQVIGIYQQGSPVDVSGTVVDLAGGEETDGHFDIINESSATFMLRVRRVKLQTVMDATDYLCWGKDESSGICYPETVVGPNEDWTSPDAYSWAALDTGILSVYHVANGNPGVALYRYYIIDNSGEALDSVDVRFTSTVSLKEEVGWSTKLYPNPLSDRLFIDVQTSDEAFLSVKIFNLMGELVMDETIVNGLNEFDVSDYNSGIYFYSIIENGKAAKTKKLVIR